MPWRLAPIDYPSVRAAIDISLSEGSLSDDIIGLSVYKGAAEQSVLSRVPTADTEDASAQNHFHVAAILYCAAALCFAIPGFTRESGPEFNAEFDRIDPKVLAADLRARADAEVLAGAPSVDISPVPAGMFGVARGSRGRW